MRILLDECVNPRLRAAFPGDAVKTVAEMNWRSLTNGRLLEEAAVHFDLLITLDQNLRVQNQAGKYPLGIVVLVTRLNDLATYRPRFAEIRDLAKQTQPGQVNLLQIT
jgi:predicted nuclease of predicted toxin-antitoxin system